VGGRYDDPEPGATNAFQDYGHSHWHNSLIWGENLQNISILGSGSIYGKGLSRGFYASEGWEKRGINPGIHLKDGIANKAIALKLCRNVILKDFTILNGGHFGILATGVNNLPDPRCRGADWVKPITEMDAYRRFYQLALLASQGVVIDGIAGPNVPGGASSPIDPNDVADQLSKVLPLGALGSNAYGLGKDATTNGKGMVLANPHFPWDGPERFYESQRDVDNSWMRAIYRSSADGSYVIRTVAPIAYTIPMDGTVGELHVWLVDVDRRRGGVGGEHGDVVDRRPDGDGGVALPAPAADDEVVLVDDVEELCAYARCPCAASDDQPY